MAHTHGKLTVSVEDDGMIPAIFLELEGYGTLAEMGGGKREEREANANHLALCWNLHDDLLAACQSALDLSQHADGCGWWNVSAADLQFEAGRRRANEACDCHIKSLTEAISKVTGQ